MRNTSLQYLLATFVILSLSYCNSTDEENVTSDDILWYEQPAQSWEEALPLGNGRLGVMVFGDPAHEHIQLNDDSMWPAEIGWDEPEGTEEDLENIRNLLFEGKNEEADRLFVKKFSNKSIIRSHQTLGDLFIELDHNNITDYRRDLNLSNATASVSYRSDGDIISEEIFVSKPHQAIIIQIESEARKGLNGKIRLSRPQDEGFATATTKTTDEGLLVMLGEVTQRSGRFSSRAAPILEGVRFETYLKIVNVGGEIIVGNDYLEFHNVEKADLYIVSNSSFYYDDFSAQNSTELDKLLADGIETIKEEHIRDHQKLYSRVALSLNDTKMDTLPTDLRTDLIQQGINDPGLEALLFQYGRYLLIASSRQGTNPANLQGLWNQHITAPWNADYHLNINLQMNYWPANLTNLDELNMPLFDYIDRLIQNGKETAIKNYGCRGSFIPHASDLWAPTWLRAPTAYWGCSVGAGGWLMQHYWQHFEFTLDTNFLRERAYPALAEVAQFYSDWIIEDPRDNTLISAPSTSPENRFLNADGKAVASCLGSAMDQQVIEEVFDNYIKACGILKVKGSLLDTILEQRQLLRPGFILGEDGRILEWDREYQETEPGHRHMSHLYGFYPGTSVTKDETPEIFEAVRKTLDHRLNNGGAGTGWSRAWLINCSARLLDGEMAYEHIRLLFKKSLFINLFDAHPPFQIDGNFGYTSGVAEMLLQSHETNMIRILPALPMAWESGHVRGLKARSGIKVDIYWSKNVLDKVIFHSRYDHTFDLVYMDKKIPIELHKGKSFTYNH